MTFNHFIKGLIISDNNCLIVFSRYCIAVSLYLHNAGYTILEVIALLILGENYCYSKPVVVCFRWHKLEHNNFGRLTADGTVPVILSLYQPNVILIFQ